MKRAAFEGVRELHARADAYLIRLTSLMRYVCGTASRPFDSYYAPRSPIRLAMLDLFADSKRSLRRANYHLGSFGECHNEIIRDNRRTHVVEKNAANTFTSCPST